MRGHTRAQPRHTKYMINTATVTYMHHKKKDTIAQTKRYIEKSHIITFIDELMLFL
jgi:hypothetical protein